MKERFKQVAGTVFDYMFASLESGDGQRLFKSQCILETALGNCPEIAPEFPVERLLPYVDPSKPTCVRFNAIAVAHALAATGTTDFDVLSSLLQVGISDNDLDVRRITIACLQTLADTRSIGIHDMVQFKERVEPLLNIAARDPNEGNVEKKKWVYTTLANNSCIKRGQYSRIAVPQRFPRDSSAEGAKGFYKGLGINLG